MSSDDNDKSTEQVLDYYKKYSQNRNLPKYFSGTSVSYLPSTTAEIDVECSSKNISATTRILCAKITDNAPKFTLNYSSSNGSPSDSSLSEHKKLEWDNGADIGYHSARKSSEKKLQKSLSLPILDSLTDVGPTAIVPHKRPSTVITHSTSNDNIGILVFSSSSSSEQESSKTSARQDPISSSTTVKTSITQKTQSSSTSTSANTGTLSCKVNTPCSSDDTRFGDFQKSINYLKQKIGSPGAHSTPNMESQVDKPKIGKGVSLDPSLVAHLSHKLKSKSTVQEKLGSESSRSGRDSSETNVSKPDTDTQEELSKKTSSSKSRAKKTVKNVETKIIELSISTPINVNCKGLDIASRGDIFRTPYEVVPKAVQTESTTYHHMETQFNFGNELKKSEIVNVSEGMTDLASSFEYISAYPNSAAKLNKDRGESDESKTKNVLVNVATGISGVLKQISISQSTTSTSSRLTSCGEEDIDKHLDLLQKLLKTKKVNSSSKRKYIKKLLKQLSDLETSTDSSSDLFIPKRDTENEKPNLKVKARVAFKDSRSSEGKRSDSFSFHKTRTFHTTEKPSVVPLPCSIDDVDSECQKFIAELSLTSKKLRRTEAIEQDISDGLRRSEFESLEAIKGSKPSSKTSSSKLRIGLRSLSGPSSAVDYTNLDALESDKVPSSSEKDEKCTCSEYDKESSSNSLHDHYRHSTPRTETTSRSEKQQSLKRHLERNASVLTTDRSAKSVKTDSLSKPQSAVEKSSDDYLLRFAENERTYQLNWINNEIRHLSKLKHILELKAKKPSSAKTNIYNVAQSDGSNNKLSERNYVIKTDLNISPEQDVNYMLDGKKYVVSDPEKSSTDSDKAVIADIEVNLNENQTNIKLCRVCSLCKQTVCICSSGNTFPSKLLSFPSEGACLTCQEVVCQCKAEIVESDGSSSENSYSNGLSSAETNAKASLQLDSEQTKLTSQYSELVSQEDFNSLQEVFKKCCCTVLKTNCSCDFVRKLLDNFQVEPIKVDISSEAVQTDKVLIKDSATSVETDVNLGGQEIATQSEINSQRIGLQTLRDMMCKCTQSESNGGNITSETMQTDKVAIKDGTTSVEDVANLAQEMATQAEIISQHISLQTLRDMMCKCIQSESNGRNEMIQVDQKTDSQERGSWTGSHASHDRASQISKPEQTMKTQTFKRSFEFDAALQATQPTSSSDAQAEQISKPSSQERGSWTGSVTLHDRASQIFKPEQTVTAQTFKMFEISAALQATQPTSSSDAQTAQLSKPSIENLDRKTSKPLIEGLAREPSRPSTQSRSSEDARMERVLTPLIEDLGRKPSKASIEDFGRQPSRPLIRDLSRQSSKPFIEELGKKPSKMSIEDLSRRPSKPFIEDLGSQPSKPFIEDLGRKPSKPFTQPMSSRESRMEQASKPSIEDLGRKPSKPVTQPMSSRESRMEQASKPSIEDLGRKPSKPVTQPMSSRDSQMQQAAKTSIEHLERKSSKPSIEDLGRKPSKPLTQPMSSRDSQMQQALKPSIEHLERKSSKALTEDLGRKPSKALIQPISSRDSRMEQPSKPLIEYVERQSSKPSIEDLGRKSSKPIVENLDRKYSRSSTSSSLKHGNGVSSKGSLKDREDGSQSVKPTGGNNVGVQVYQVYEKGETASKRKGSELLEKEITSEQKLSDKEGKGEAYKTIGEKEVQYSKFTEKERNGEDYRTAIENETQYSKPTEKEGKAEDYKTTIEEEVQYSEFTEKEGIAESYRASIEKETQYSKPTENEGKADDYKATVDKETQYSKSTERSDETTTSTSYCRSTASSRVTCCCCKQKAFLAEVSYLQEGDDSLAVCSRCYRARYCSYNQRAVCRCWTCRYPKQKPDSCRCPKQKPDSCPCPKQKPDSCRYPKPKPDAQQHYCKCCRLEVSKCLRRPHWMAYSVTLKKDGVSKKNRRKSSKGSLENIKVQEGWSWKSVKNKENYYKKDDDNRRNGLQDEKRVSEDKDNMEKGNSKEKVQKDDKRLDEEEDVHYTLTEYLIKNKPGFISSAEYRRQMLLNSRILREQQKDTLKLNFLENNLKNANEGKYKLFTEREMKDINRKNYQRLPEIQNKLTSQRQNRLRHADRLISNVFAKTIQKSVLRGRGNFPIDQPLTSL